jgi:hypothetical protein
MQTTTLSSTHLSGGFVSGRTVFEPAKYLVTRVFGCWHLKLTRPITHDNEAYRACIRCGMRRAFNLETWHAEGPFYAENINRRRT